MKRLPHITAMLLLLGMGASAHAAPAAKSIRFQWNGSGCAKSESTSPWDPMVVQLVASKDIGGEFLVKRGGGASPKDSRKSCELIVSSEEPLQIALERIELKGAGALAADAPVALKVDTSSQGTPGNTSYELSIPSGKADFVVNRSIDDGELFWSACGRSLLVSTKLAIKGNASVESRINRIGFNLQAKPCKKP